MRSDAFDLIAQSDDRTGSLVILIRSIPARFGAYIDRERSTPSITAIGVTMPHSAVAMKGRCVAGSWGVRVPVPDCGAVPALAVATSADSGSPLGLPMIAGPRFHIALKRSNKCRREIHPPPRLMSGRPPIPSHCRAPDAEIAMCWCMRVPSAADVEARSSAFGCESRAGSKASSSSSRGGTRSALAPAHHQRLLPNVFSARSCFTHHALHRENPPDRPLDLRQVLNWKRRDGTAAGGSRRLVAQTCD